MDNLGTTSTLILPMVFLVFEFRYYVIFIKQTVWSCDERGICQMDELKYGGCEMNRVQRKERLINGEEAKEFYFLLAINYKKW